MDEIRRVIWLERVPPILELTNDPGFRVFLPGKYEGGVRLFVAEWHSVEKGVLSGSPPKIDTRGLVHKRPGCVEGLMPKCLNHPQQLRLGPLARHTSHEANDSSGQRCRKPGPPHPETASLGRPSHCWGALTQKRSQQLRSPNVT